MVSYFHPGFVYLNNLLATIDVTRPIALVDCRVEKQSRCATCFIMISSDTSTNKDFVKLLFLPTYILGFSTKVNHTTCIEFQMAKNQPLQIQHSRPSMDSQEPKTTKKINSRKGFFRKSPFCTFSCINPGFGGPWNMLQNFLLPFS